MCAYAPLPSLHLSSKVLAGKTSFTSSFTAGEAAVLAGISLLKDLEPLEKLLAAFPDLAAFYAKNSADVDAALAGLSPYFARPAATA